MQVANQVGMITIDDLEMVRDSMVYRYLLEILQKGLDDLQYSHLSLKDLHTRCVEYIINRATTDQRKLQKEMRRRFIKTWDGEQMDGILFTNIRCRGYQQRFGIVKEELRSQIRVKITSYISEIGKQLNT